MAVMTANAHASGARKDPSSAPEAGMHSAILAYQWEPAPCLRRFDDPTAQHPRRLSTLTHRFQTRERCAQGHLSRVNSGRGR
jgi:hypothetical protein